MKSFRVSLRCGLLTMICATTLIAQSIQTDYDRSYNLANLKTYDFSQPDRKPYDPLAQSPLNDRRIHDALDSQLKAHGFANNSNGDADFLITYFVTTKQGLDIQDNRYGILQRTGGLNVSQVTEGTIVVIFLDRVTHQEVWRGLVSGMITPKDLDKNINKGITKLVQKFIKNQAGKK